MYSSYMELALQEARTAFEKGEVPVGAVIVKDRHILSTAHNLTETLKDPTAHAEILAIRKACERLGGWRLEDCAMVVTLEPCPMCAGAIVQARLDGLVIGAFDFKAGAAGSVYNIVQDRRLNHRVRVVYGVMQEECSELLKRFFYEKR
ncbi:MAG: tRNA adenosine(34) deaminase TadA [Bacillota bacterium]|nr:tRNA adenosine(34) deaminase TadA [Bacillota bacterium]MDD4706769.1 tRNA adenosine(34) deaminase TadA [Bacillota bacterium]